MASSSGLFTHDENAEPVDETSTQPPKSAVETKWWSDKDMETFGGQYYPDLNTDFLVRLGENWIVMLTEGRNYHTAEVTVLLALHLRECNRHLAVICGQSSQHPVDLRKSLFDDISKSQVFEEMEKVTGIKSSQPGKVIIKGQNSVSQMNFSTKLNIPKKDSRFPSVNITSEVTARMFIDEIRKEPKKWQAALYSFLAALTCRCIVKSPKDVIRYWKTTASTTFYTMYEYDFCKPKPEFPVPKFESIKNMLFDLRPGKPLTVCLMKGFLQAFSKPFDIFNPKVRYILNYTLLNHVRYNGLGPLQFFLTAYKRFKQDVFKIIKRLNHEPFEESVRLLYEFLDKYLLSTRTSTDRFYAYARLFDSAYFANLSTKRNQELSAHLVSIYTKTTEEKAWKTGGLSSMNAERRNEIFKAVQLVTEQVTKEAFGTCSVN